MSALQSLEKSLDNTFVKRAPALPAAGKKALIEYLPWLNLILGFVALYTAYILWHWAHLVSNLVHYANNLTNVYGGTAFAGSRLTFGVWAGLAVLVVEALLYIAAFPGTQAHKKSGWDLMFYALLVNILYSIVVLFTDYGSVGHLIGNVIGSGIGLYLLFQIRTSYTKSGATPARESGRD